MRDESAGNIIEFPTAKRKTLRNTAIAGGWALAAGTLAYSTATFGLPAFLLGTSALALPVWRYLRRRNAINMNSIFSPFYC